MAWEFKREVRLHDFFFYPLFSFVILISCPSCSPPDCLFQTLSVCVDPPSVITEQSAYVRKASSETALSSRAAISAFFALCTGRFLLKCVCLSMCDKNNEWWIMVSQSYCSTLKWGHFLKIVCVCARDRQCGISLAGSVMFSQSSL